MKKKVLSLILVLALFAAMAVPAMALGADGPNPGWDDVPTGYNPGKLVPVDLYIPVARDWTVELIALNYYGTAKAAVVNGLRAANARHFMLTGNRVDLEAFVPGCITEYPAPLDGTNFVLPGVVAGVARVRDIEIWDMNVPLFTLNGVSAWAGTDSLFYRIAPGDTLTKIVREYYPGLPANLVINYVFGANKVLGLMQNINRIYAGSYIFLPEIRF